MSDLKTRLTDALKSNLAHKAAQWPEGADVFTTAFAGLSATRTYADGRPDPISYAEIAAYCNLMRLPLEPDHVRILRAMDEAWLVHARSGPKAPTQEITPELFDALG